MTTSIKRYSPDQPGIYVILARGYLEESWSDYLGGLTISFLREPDGELLTSLTGELSDQSALMGVLNTLSDHHVVLLLVARTSSLQHPQIVSSLFGATGI